MVRAPARRSIFLKLEPQQIRKANLSLSRLIAEGAVT